MELPAPTLGNMQKLTPQENKIYQYIKNNSGCTTHDMQHDLWIQCPSARITAIRQKGFPLISIGKKKYPNARPFEMYSLKEPYQNSLL